MVQPKYDPQDALQRVKLLMNYDSKKTLTENRQIIFEQPTGNVLSLKDLMGDTSWWGNVNWKQRAGVKGVVDALDGWVDMENLNYVLKTIKGLDGKCFYDEAAQKNISATAAFVMLYKEDEGDDLKKDVESVGTRTLPTGAEQVKRSIIAAIDAQIAKGCSSSGGGGGGGGGKSGGGGTKFKECTKEYKLWCKSEAIKKIQECLGLVADGKFGRKTEAKLKEKFPDKEYYKVFTDADVDVICKKTTPNPTPAPAPAPADTEEDLTDYSPDQV